MERETTVRFVRGAAFAGAATIVYVLAVLTPVGQAFDSMSLGAFGWMGSIAEVLAGLRTPLAVVSIGSAGVSLAIGAWRRRFADVLVAVAVIVGVFAMNILLRDVVLGRPPYLRGAGYAYNTLPSGHVAITTVCWSVVVTMCRSRAWGHRSALVGGGVCLVVALASVAGFAHRGSDVVAGVLLAGVAAVCLRGRLLTGRRVTRRLALVCSAIGLALVAATTTALVIGSDPVASLTLSVLLMLSVAAALSAVFRLAVPRRYEPLDRSSGRYAEA